MAEDTVCGSGHCYLVPFLVKQLGKSKIVSLQVSKRGSETACSSKMTAG
ncbi:PhzF family phenazine biosynthesis protein [Campylobacter concisus]|nr:PhzF family phenazine biosynthesis protein [Campylobacter concisus]